MNKRIQELKDQCYISIADRDGDTEYDMDKFARLLILECARVASDYDGAHYVGTAIERHFGVEE